MHTITAPVALTALPDLAMGVSQEFRARMEAGPLAPTTCVVDTSPTPVLLAEFYTPSGRLYALRFSFPPGSRERMARRVALLTGLLGRTLNASGAAGAETSE
jgi:hypothetical protein